MHYYMNTYCPSASEQLNGSYLGGGSWLGIMMGGGSGAPDTCGIAAIVHVEDHNVHW